MGAEPRPICTDGADDGTAVGIRGADAGADIGCDGKGPEPAGDIGCDGGGVGPTPCGWLGSAPKAAGLSDAMVGPMAEKAPGSGGTAVLATPMGGWLETTGGGVGDSTSWGGGAGCTAGAAPAWSLAPHPRQNL